MSDNKARASNQWTGVQAYSFALVCLVVGVASGWILRVPNASASGQTAKQSMSAANSPTTSQSPHAASPMNGTPDTLVAPMLEQLKSDPKNADLLAQIGNTYYDAKQFPAAIDYYERSLQVRPAEVSVRTDLGTAYWYTGNADTAIQQLNQALTYDANYANALFNLGVVKWQGKQDGKGALAAWQKLLDTNPNYENKDKVLEFMSQVRDQAASKP